MKFRTILLIITVLLLNGCKCQKVKETEMSITKEAFGSLDGKDIVLYTLTNSNGIKAKITNYGGIVTSLEVPDKDGNFTDIVLGHDKLEDYLKGHPYFGALVGRYANRIGNAKFTINDKEYKLAANNNKIHHLHGGIKGFDKVVWDTQQMQDSMCIGLKMTYLSKDGEEGYPGNLHSTVIYSLNNKNELRIEYYAKTDKPTIANLTHHGYFNLAGHGNGDILGHKLMLNADHFTPVDEGLIPTGELRPVKNTPFDFTKPTAIGARIDPADNLQLQLKDNGGYAHGFIRIDQDNLQLTYGGGYDHNFVLKNKSGKLKTAATVFEPTSGRFMEALTTEPGVQFYCGNFLDGTNIGKGGKVYKHRYGFCLEPQPFPDSPNKPEFPSVVLKPGDTYRHTTVYRFSVKK